VPERALNGTAGEDGRLVPCPGRLTDAEIADSYAGFVMRAVLTPPALRKWVRHRERQSG
jgi:hypothetical protein